MDSIRLTFSSRRIQALINNTYLASLMSFSFFPYFQLSSCVPITLYADSPIKSNLRSGLIEQLRCWMVSQDSAEDIEAALTIPIPQRTCIHVQCLSLVLPFLLVRQRSWGEPWKLCCILEEAAAQPWVTRVRKEFPNPVTLTSFFLTLTVVICFDIFFKLTY